MEKAGSWTDPFRGRFGLLALVVGLGGCGSAERPASNTDEVAVLSHRLKEMEGLVPDQSAVMTFVARHFNEVWFSLEFDNWPLAQFNLDETFSNLRWAVRAKPIRKDSTGKEVKLNDILAAIENAQLPQMKLAIEKKDKTRAREVYRDLLSACYGCHKASDKPYLRPKIPDRPAEPMLELDPKVNWPQ